MQGNHLVNAHRFLGWALALFLVAGPCFGATLTGRVVAVSDGDTPANNPGMMPIATGWPKKTPIITGVSASRGWINWRAH